MLVGAGSGYPGSVGVSVGSVWVGSGTSEVGVAVGVGTDLVGVSSGVGVAAVWGFRAISST